MSRSSQFTALILAAGRGERAGFSQPKQFVALGGRPLIRWSVEAFARHPACARIVVVTRDATAMRAALAHLAVDVVAGGATRQESVACGLAAIAADDDALILVHDAARPGLDAAVIDRLLSALAHPDVSGAIPALPVADTLAQGGAMLGDIVSREGLWQVQTPQAFRAAALRRAHAAADQMRPATDDAQLVRALGEQVALVPGDSRLTKLTHASDLAQLETLLAGRSSHRAALRVGLGFDVHRLVSGDGLWLGGIRIPHDRRLDGHSDADVVLHAITDAVLGAIAAGDIGDHFSPSDARWAGAASDQFLAHAVRLVTEAGFAVAHIDCTIICEAPRIGPHRNAIAASIAAIAGIPATSVAVKATTTEKLGYTGRGEGIAVQAIATVEEIR